MYLVYEGCVCTIRACVCVRVCMYLECVCVYARAHVIVCVNIYSYATLQKNVLWINASFQPKL